MKNKQNGYPTEPFMEDDTKIYFPSGQSYTLGQFLSQVNPETRLSDESEDNANDGFRG
ncbi:hypothetical protein [uncultured Ruminococcus sp.]|uniref:hypothetical protein n=1 Tax=uncultured Ruminococcus sp. TaxID=165186 RepID=UPI0025EC0C6D|nr:hypothetical protein [uncultured Ruminococcus sp.]